MTKETIEQEALSDIREIVYRHLSGNYLIGSMGKKLLTEEIEAYIKGRTDQASDWKRVGELANEIQKIVRNEKPTSNRER